MTDLFGFCKARFGCGLFFLAEIVNLLKMKNFWQKIKKPIFAQAPMDDVTDAVFRQMIAKYGKPDVMWTEFVSADGLANPIGRKALKRKLIFSKKEKPIVAQLFGAKPENFKIAAKYVASLGFDGIDINMGCPDRKVEKTGAGASLIKNPELAKKIILKTKEGAGHLPVSVKTRIGYKTNEIEKWLKVLLEVEPSAIILHLRTRNELSNFPARFSVLKQAVKIRDQHKSRTLILGNGDIKDRQVGLKIIKQTGADGVMIGRGLFGRPWLLSKKLKKEPPISKKLQILTEHVLLFEKIFKNKRNFSIMKKHFKSYCSDFPRAKELRIKLMESERAEEIAEILKEFIKSKIR